MGWWKADPVPESSKTKSNSLLPGQPPAIAGLQSQSNESSCPVDSKTREIWLQQAKQQSKNTSSPPLPSNHPNIEPQLSAKANDKLAQIPSEQCSSDRIDQSPIHHNVPVIRNTRPLSQEREVSTIPRAYPFSVPQATPALSNAESETGHDKASGNWIYPSESQFFNAVMRKHPQATSPKELASSVSSIIPIHNAVNERAWMMIGKWEANQPANKTCAGPKLLRFEGKGAGAKTPRAIMKSWSGYQEPFDRHDWTIQRCDGTEVEYVIDFYQGKSPAGQVNGTTQNAPASGMGGINFYLDVRPKLNSFEGCKMRLEKFVGWS